MSIFGELRKRHLVEIALIYMGAGWLCIEITDFIVGNYGFSRKILDTVVLLAILGFPAFLIIGWFHGERGQQRVRRGEVWLLATLGTLGAIGTYRIATGEEAPSGPSLETGAPSEAGTAREVSAEAMPDLGRGSLAVLPFKNRIPGEDLAWLGAGLADLLTTNFAQMPGMRVVGRQALYDLLMEEGRSEEEEIPESLALTVARGAGARMLLWGTVTGTPEDMRIDAQLVELENGTIVFADWVRGSDVFALVDSLTARLSRRARVDRPGEPLVRVSQLGTRDMDAFHAFQRGVAAERAGRPEEAEAHFEEAARIDSAFVLPLVRLAFRERPPEVEGRLDVDGSTFDPDDMEPDEVDPEELARALVVGALTPDDVREIARLAGLGEEERREIWQIHARLSAEAGDRAAAFHRDRALRALENMGGEWAAGLGGMSEEEMLASIDAVIGHALGPGTVVVRGLVADSTGHPIPPAARRPPPPDSSSS